MEAYYANANARLSDTHEVHRASCRRAPARGNGAFLGHFAACAEAVEAARVSYTRVDGCAHCSPECHTPERAAGDR